MLPLFGAREKIASAFWKFTLESVMFQIDPKVKAAECERVIRVVADPDRRSVLISLRSLWVSLGNDKPYSDSQIHAELMCSTKRYELTRTLTLSPGRFFTRRCPDL
jgi:hypothetical protein